MDTGDYFEEVPGRYTREARRRGQHQAGDKMVAMAKHDILQYVPVRSLKETKGMVPGLDLADLRDER